MIDGGFAFDTAHHMCTVDTAAACGAGRLTGTVIGVSSMPSPPLSVEGHAHRLIDEAVCKERLGKMYIWCVACRAHQRRHIAGFSCRVAAGVEQDGDACDMTTTGHWFAGSQDCILRVGGWHGCERTKCTITVRTAGSAGAHHAGRTCLIAMLKRTTGISKLTTFS